MNAARALLLLLVGSLGCPGSTQQSQTATQPEARSDLRPFLWRVDGSGSPSYLLGTFHIGVDPDEVLPATVWDKLDSARVVVLEVNMAVPEALGLGRQPPGKTLDQQMSPEQWQRLIGKLDISAEQAAELAKYKPWVIVTQLIHTLVPETRSIDTEVEARARKRDAEIEFLEDVLYQARLFDKFMTVEKLLGLLDSKDRQRTLLKAQADAYRSGDEARMYAESLAPEVFANSPPGAREELVFARNRAWLPTLLPHLKRGGAFVAVGASHLIGDGGLVDLLRDRGFRVTRIRG